MIVNTQFICKAHDAMIIDLLANLDRLLIASKHPSHTKL